MLGALNLTAGFQLINTCKEVRMTNPGIKPLPQEPTILIIDDAPDDCMALRDYLKTHGVRVVIAQDEEQGFQKAHTVQPDLILLGLSMSGEHRIALCRRLKAIKGLGDISVIPLLPASDTRAGVDALKMETIDTIFKPIQPEAVWPHIKFHCDLSSARKQLTQQSTRLHEEIAMRQQLEKTLRENEQSYRTLIEQAPGAVVLLDLDKRCFVDVNDSAVRLFGLSREALLQVNLIDVSPPLQPNGRPSLELATGEKPAGDGRRYPRIRMDLP